MHWCEIGLVSSFPAVFKDFQAEGLLHLFRWFMGVHFCSRRSIDRNDAPCAVLCLSLVIDFWTHALYVNAHMNLHADSPCLFINNPPLPSPNHVLTHAMISLYSIPFSLVNANMTVSASDLMS